LDGLPRRKPETPADRHPRYSTSHRAERERVDALLEKAARDGLHSLTDGQKRILREYSDRLKRREGGD
jgi:hypothetical protein